eukprot:11166244-Lingulodinium_polyedra.AAC.1
MQQQQHATTTTYESMQPQHEPARGNIMQQRQQQQHAKNYTQQLQTHSSSATHTHTHALRGLRRLPATARLPRASLAPGSPGKTLAALPA